MSDLELLMCCSSVIGGDRSPLHHGIVEVRGQWNYGNGGVPCLLHDGILGNQRRLNDGIGNWSPWNRGIGVQGPLYHGIERVPRQLNDGIAGVWHLLHDGSVLHHGIAGALRPLNDGIGEGSVLHHGIAGARRPLRDGKR